MLIGEQMYEERTQIDWDNLTTQVQTPFKIIGAGKSDLVSKSKIYAEKAQGPTELVIVKNAEHNFNEEGAAEELYKESLNWIKKFSQ